ncbi:TonB-dependent receptor plug domain-containing protein [Anaerohalosphaera lusitana]|nr:TonB-dependent receptor [Anaerohalosphaera lusitana]
MSLEELMDVPVVSASRQSNVVSQSGAAVSVITAEQIHNSGLTTIPEILQLSPAVDVRRLTRGRYAVGIRGNMSLNSDRTLVLIDGRTAINPVWAGTNWQNLPVLIEDIERIEIVRGPISAAWGANAASGVINIISKNPEDTQGTLLSFTVNEFGDTYNYLRYGGTSKDLTYRISAGYEDLTSSLDATAGKFESANPVYNPAIDFDKYKVNDFLRNYRFNADFVYAGSEDTELALGVGQSYAEQGDLESAGFYAGKDYLTSSTRLYARMEHNYDDETSARLQWTGNFFHSHEPDRIDRYAYYENELEAQYNFLPHPQHQISIGGNFRWTHIDIGSRSDAEQYVFDGDPYNEYWAGAYIMDRFEATDRLTFQGQFRTDWFSETKTDWSTRLSAIYALDDAKDHILWASYAKAFRSPATAFRKASRTTASGLISIVGADDDLRNEQTWSLEAGYNGKMSEDLSFNVNTWYQRFDDLIGVDQQVFGLATVNTFDNVEGADSWGSECELTWKQDWGHVSGWYAYNGFATDRKDQIIRASFPSRHKVGLRGTVGLAENWDLNAFYTYNDAIEAFASPIKNARTFNRFDINLRHTFADGNGELMFGVTDLFNKTRGPFFDIGDLISHETPGRTFFARMQWRF